MFPALAFIVPNQCDDQHGRSNADAFCAFDYGQNNSGYTYGTQVGLNPGLIQQGDVTIERLVKAIHKSPAWHSDTAPSSSSGMRTTTAEAPPAHRPLSIPKPEPRRAHRPDQLRPHGVQSNNYYTSYSLLKSLEAGFGLPCLNHACDPDVHVMSDLFGEEHHW